MVMVGVRGRKEGEKTTHRRLEMLSIQVTIHLRYRWRLRDETTGHDVHAIEKDDDFFSLFFFFFFLLT